MPDVWTHGLTVSSGWQSVRAGPSRDSRHRIRVSQHGVHRCAAGAGPVYQHLPVERCVVLISDLSSSTGIALRTGKGRAIPG
jgi:hypothetical protein